MSQGCHRQTLIEAASTAKEHVRLDTTWATTRRGAGGRVTAPGGACHRACKTGERTCGETLHASNDQMFRAAPHAVRRAFSLPLPRAPASSPAMMLFPSSRIPPARGHLPRRRGPPGGRGLARRRSHGTGALRKMRHPITARDETPSLPYCAYT